MSRASSGSGSRSETQSTFGERDAKALTEAMTVLDERTSRELRDEEFLVVTPTGSYHVDTIAETCECPDALHRGVECKHQRRIAFARGLRPIPAWVDPDAIDTGIGQHLSADPMIETATGRTEVFDR